MKSIGGMSFGSKKQIGAMADKTHELKIGEMAPKAYKEDKKAMQAHADLAKLAKREH